MNPIFRGWGDEEEPVKTEVDQPVRQEENQERVRILAANLR